MIAHLDTSHIGTDTYNYYGNVTETGNVLENGIDPFVATIAAEECRRQVTGPPVSRAPPMPLAAACVVRQPEAPEDGSGLLSGCPMILQFLLNDTEPI